MNLEPFAEFLNTIIEKLKQDYKYIPNNNNINIGESLSLIDKPEDYFPRAEILITKHKYNGWVDQRVLEQALRFSIAVHFRRENDEVAPDDMFLAIEAGQALMKIIFNTHNDAIANGRESICSGFIQIAGYPELFYEYELFPRTTSLILVGEAEIRTLDTFSNN